MASFSPLTARIHVLQDPINQLHYNRRECQQLVDHIKAFIASLEGKSYTQDLLDLQEKLFETLTDLYDVLTDIHQHSQLKQILWRDGISILVSRVYDEIRNAASEPYNAVPMAELDLILRKNEEARSLDVDHFHDMIRTAQDSDDQIRKILGVPSNQLPQAIIALHQRIGTIPNDSNPERQFLNRGLSTMQTLKAGFMIPHDAFSMTEFDVVIHHNRELGKGGFGEVLEGNWHGTKVAIKRIRNFHPALGTNEINIMKRLKHDHILQIFGAIFNSNQLILVCALKSQGDVCMFLHKTPSANRRKLCCDVSLGLVYLHENSVIHGDIKPQNILIDENGIPCLCDFGLSRIRTLLTRPPTIPLDEESMPAGTFQYMSPEQMVYGTTNEASDVYSFAMTIYEIFSGDPPFGDISCWSLLRSSVVKSANRPAKPQLQADIDRGLDDKVWSLIEDCWSQEPSNRPTAATVSLRLGDGNGCLVEPELVQPATTLEQVQDRNISMNKEHSSIGKSVGISSRNEPDVVPPLAQPQTSSPSTKVDSTIQNDPKMTSISMKNHPVMILLMGEVGAGKSTFINMAAGETLAEVGHGLDPCTSTVKHFVLQQHEYDVVFVDTPGFNHPSKTDGVILEEIINWLKSKYSQDMQFGGIVYLHDLSQPRPRDLSLAKGKNVMTPMKLSDPEIVSRVILATVDGNGLMAKRRENQLKDTTWREMQTREFTNTKDSAWSIVDAILGISPIKLCYIQDELDAICATFPKAKGKFRDLFGFKLKRPSLARN